jgi:hypothetical protein
MQAIFSLMKISRGGAVVFFRLFIQFGARGGFQVVVFGVMGIDCENFFELFSNFIVIGFELYDIIFEDFVKPLYFLLKPKFEFDEFFIEFRYLGQLLSGGLSLLYLAPPQLAQ